MSELKPRITENGIDYILVGDYYIPDLKLPEEHRPIGKYGRIHREYLREVHPARLNTLILTGELWTYLADLNEQAQERLDTIMEQMKAAEGVTEELKRTRQMEWVQRCNNISFSNSISISGGRMSDKCPPFVRGAERALFWSLAARFRSASVEDWPIKSSMLLM